MSLPEVLVWQGLRRRRLEGVYFRRQHPVGPYVLDFYCGRAKLAVEIDGVQHTEEDRLDRDDARDAWLSTLGVRTLRIPAVEVLSDLGGAIDRIFAAVTGKT